MLSLEAWTLSELMRNDIFLAREHSYKAFLRKEAEPIKIDVW
jgi:hypothetical protein